MSTRKLTLALAAILLAPAVTAQTSGAQDETRLSAALPETLPETGERAPAPPPSSSAETEGAIDPAAYQFGIGQPASEAEIAAIDIDAMPGGAGLPEGGGSYAEGETLYAEVCAACHGENLEGIAELGAPALIGGRDTLTSDKPLKTVESYWPYASTLFDYVHRAMPMDAPGSLTANEVYAISAYVLGRAGIVGEDAELDAEAMEQITMPNADGFTADTRPAER